jgi:hypothetical protein
MVCFDFTGSRPRFSFVRRAERAGAGFFMFDGIGALRLDSGS